MMHESRLVADLIDHIEEAARGAGASRVERVTIEIGALSHVTPETLRDHLHVAASGTLTDGATFAITKATDHSRDDALDVRLVSITVENV